jgi:hypothetical protein
LETIHLDLPSKSNVNGDSFIQMFSIRIPEAYYRDA